MATRFEYYITEDDSWHVFYGDKWAGQSFTPSITHTVTAVKVRLFRLGSPGTITASIRVAKWNIPTGDDLCSGTTDGNVITEDTAGEWIEFNLGNGYSLSAGTKYAIVVRVPSGDSSNALRWREDVTSPTYSGGLLIWSNDSGVSWGNDARWDFMFEEWGKVMSPLPTHFVIR